jgi:hypothetical protein
MEPNPLLAKGLLVLVVLAGGVVLGLAVAAAIIVSQLTDITSCAAGGIA